MKGINGKAILKASEIINEITEKGNLKKYKLSLYDFNLFYDTVSELYNAGHAETINEKVKDLLEEYVDMQEQAVEKLKRFL